MAGSKEIRTKIKSVQNTRKITKAMEMVAASKMRKAQERMRHARPYGDKIRTIAAHLAHANTEYRHPFLVKREGTKDVGVITITSDKGLCGGLNTNALRLMLNKVREWQGEGRAVQLTAIGNKGFGFMQRFGGNVVSHVTAIGDAPHMERLIGPVKVQIDAFAEGKIGALYIIYTRFINTMKQEPVIEQVLPLPVDRLQEDKAATRQNWDYLYEPDARAVLDQLLTRYVEQIIYQSVAENIASEQSARMVAMKSASDNAS
ncbi:MAG: F0F1 ATP synthase subunit gamma, partial [Usitatibacter sp.]